MKIRPGFSGLAQGPPRLGDVQFTVVWDFFWLEDKKNHSAALKQKISGEEFIVCSWDILSACLRLPVQPHRSGPVCSNLNSAGGSQKSEGLKWSCDMNCLQSEGRLYSAWSFFCCAQSTENQHESTDLFCFTSESVGWRLQSCPFSSHWSSCQRRRSCFLNGLLQETLPEYHSKLFCLSAPAWRVEVTDDKVRYQEGRRWWRQTAGKNNYRLQTNPTRSGRHRTHGVMALERSAPVCQIWATGRT